MIRYSMTNLAASVTPTASTANATYTAAQASQPERPFFPWRTTVATDSWLLFDFLTATMLDVVALIHANFTSATIQGNATDVWTSPSYTQSVTLTRAANDRYQHGHRIVGSFNYRYLRIVIPTQTRTDGNSYFRLGGVWAGAIVSPPRDILMDPTEEKIEPREDTTPSHNGWRLRQIRGNPLIKVTGRALASGEVELASWREVERQQSAADYFLALLRDSYPAETYVMRRMDMPAWSHGRAWSTSEHEYEEVVR